MNWIRIFHYGLILGFAELRVFWSNWGVWLVAHIGRATTSAATLILLGRLLGSEEKVHYLLIGQIVMVGTARVLFLDEPTTGMDPLGARDFREVIKELRSEGRTILLTTHDMAEAEAVCDRVTLIDHGRVLAVETPRTLSRLMSQFERIDFEWDNDGLAPKLRALPGVASVSPIVERNSYRIELSDESAARGVLDLLVASGVTSIRTSRPSLEEVYLHIIGRKS